LPSANNVILNQSLLKSLPLQRSKSLSSADALARGIASLGLGLSVDEIGTFPPEVTAVINKASEDPNQLTARCLMELTTHLLKRTVEGRRYRMEMEIYSIHALMYFFLFTLLFTDIRFRYRDCALQS
jgi:hypothetical protein